MSTEEIPILVSVANGVASITLNRPAVLNALNNALAQAYLTESRNSQATAARRATTDLSGRLM